MAFRQLGFDGNYVELVENIFQLSNVLKPRLHEVGMVT
jgi:hypothetical protein